MREPENVEQGIATESVPVVDYSTGWHVTSRLRFLTTHAQRDAQLNSARKRHRMNVEIALQDEGDDPLEAYDRFVDWTVENNPHGKCRVGSS